MTSDERRQLSKAAAGAIAVVTGLAIAPVVTITATIAYLAGREIATSATVPKPAEPADE